MTSNIGLHRWLPSKQSSKQSHTYLGFTKLLLIAFRDRVPMTVPLKWHLCHCKTGLFYITFHHDAEDPPSVDYFMNFIHSFFICP